MMADLGCQLDYVWNQLKAKVLGESVRIEEGRRPTLNLCLTFWWQPMLKGVEEGSFCS